MQKMDRGEAMERLRVLPQDYQLFVRFIDRGNAVLAIQDILMLLEDTNYGLDESSMDMIEGIVRNGE